MRPAKSQQPRTGTGKGTPYRHGREQEHGQTSALPPETFAGTWRDLRGSNRMSGLLTKKAWVGGTIQADLAIFSVIIFTGEKPDFCSRLSLHKPSHNVIGMESLKMLIFSYLQSQRGNSW